METNNAILKQSYQQMLKRYTNEHSKANDLIINVKSYRELQKSLCYFGTINEWQLHINTIELNTLLLELEDKRDLLMKAIEKTSRLLTDIILQENAATI